MKVFGKRVVVSVEEPEVEQTTKSGIYIPVTKENVKPDRGIVYAVGDIEKIKMGQVIIFEPYASMEITVDDMKLHVIKEENIVAILQ